MTAGADGLRDPVPNSPPASQAEHLPGFWILGPTPKVISFRFSYGRTRFCCSARLMGRTLDYVETGIDRYIVKILNGPKGRHIGYVVCGRHDGCECGCIPQREILPVQYLV
jgi:hypothetical protein